MLNSIFRLGEKRPEHECRMERNFPIIPIFQNFRPTSRGTPKISEWKSVKCPFHSLPTSSFRNKFINNFKSVLFCIMLTVSRVACCVECFSRKSHWALKRTLLLSRKDFRRWYINFSNNRLKTESSDIGR